MPVTDNPKESITSGFGMRSPAPEAPGSKTALVAGRILSGLVALFLLFDSIPKVFGMAPAVDGTVQLGYPESVVPGIGLALLFCTILYMIPRTAIFGAILLTGYLGGAVATQVRLESLWLLFPVVFALLTWAGIYLRDERLRTLVPLRSREYRVAQPHGSGHTA